MNIDNAKNRIVISVLFSIILFIIIQISPSVFSDIESASIDARYRLRSYIDHDPDLVDNISLIAIDDYTLSTYSLDELPLGSYESILSELNKMLPKQAAIDIFIKDKQGCEREQRRSIIDQMFLFISPYVARMDLSIDTNTYIGEEDCENDGNLDIFIWESLGINRYPKVESTRLPVITDIVSYNDAIFYGYTNIISDYDGKLRRFPIVSSLNGRVVPHLVFQSIIEGFQYDISNMRLDGQNLLLDRFFNGVDTVDISIPLDSDGLMPVNFLSYDSYKSKLEGIRNSYISAVDIIRNQGSNVDMSDKLVILGDISTAGQDIIDTPLEKIQNPIVYHMVANSILNQDFISTTTIFVDLMITIILCLTISIIGANSNTLRMGLLGLSVVAAYIALSFGIFIYLGVLFNTINVILPSISLFLVLFGLTVYNSQVRMGVLEGSLSSYLSPNLMEKVKDDPDILKIGGSRKKISVLFSDIVGFTSFCDSVDSAEVQEVLEDYFEKMTRAIFNAEGIVDKYLGDGILAFFENSKDSVSSPHNAMKAAIDMQRGAQELNDKYIKMNRPPFEIRIGIATGYAKVGNIGPPDKVDYTIIGSVVNKSARLEGQADPGGLAIDNDTSVFVKDDYHFTVKKDQELKGFSNTEDVYILNKKDI